jgi:HD superfamily phosphodiesterase
MNRLERVRRIVDGILRGVQSPEDCRCGFVHLYGVSATAAFLALRRVQNVELTALAGMLHDLAAYETGTSEDHALRSARRAAEILAGLEVFTELEIETIRSAIAHHSDKTAVHDAVSELIKDADVLHHLLYDPDLSPQESHVARRKALRLELDL